MLKELCSDSDHKNSTSRCVIVSICLSIYIYVCVCVFFCPHICVCVCVCVADYKRGFGGRYGVEVEKQDQCALGYEHKESLAKHESQKGTDTPEHNHLPHLPSQPPSLPHNPHPQASSQPDTPSFTPSSSSSAMAVCLYSEGPPPVTHPPPLQHQPVNMNTADELIHLSDHRLTCLCWHLAESSAPHSLEVDVILFDRKM